MAVILKSCRVPWAVSPSMSGLTLVHSETGVSPECSIRFGGGRMRDDGLVDSRRIEICFESAWFARCGPKPDDDDIGAIGYEIRDRGGTSQNDYAEWRKLQWRSTGLCPNPGFYLAVHSDWLESASRAGWRKLNHYVLEGRDGYVEVLAERFRWREWLWTSGARDGLTSDMDVVALGEGDE